MDSLATHHFYYLGLIVLFPLLGALITGTLGHFLSKRWVWTIACSAVGLSFLFALSAVMAMWTGRLVPGGVDGTQEVLESPRLEWTAFEWISSGGWADGEDGYVPVEQFQVFGPVLYERCCRLAGSAPAWAQGCAVTPAGCWAQVYTPTHPPDAVLQPGIGGIRARLTQGGHRFQGVNISLKLVMDALSAVMVLIITGVGFLIHIYAVGYMRHDRSKARFFAYMNLFVAAMLLLVLGGNLVVMFIGWEGVGLCSYLLIGYYYEQKENCDAGKKAFIVNRVGDFAFVLGVLTLFFAFGTFDFAALEAAVRVGEGAMLSRETVLLVGVGCVLLFIGCTGKSAQIPLFVWLPDAMAGPTPVSALIHAATMVTAGVYLVARLHFLFVLSPAAMMLIALVGGATALLAASIAVVQTDIKRVLAYSTVSQLGFMFLALGFGAWWVAIFHLMTHAFFKALLFLGAGSVIDALHHEQDVRKMGALRQKLPVTAVTFLVGALAIAGVPLLSGFFSKDQILWFVWYHRLPLAWGPLLSWSLWSVATVTAALTAFYMFRLYFLTFEGKSRVEPSLLAEVGESPTTMLVPLAVLALLSVVGGYWGLPHVLSGGVAELETLRLWLEGVLYSPMPHAALTSAGVVVAEWLLMGVSVLVAGVGIGLAYWLYVRRPEQAARLAGRLGVLYRLLSRKYYVDELYRLAVVNPVLVLGRFFHRVIDVIVIDFFVVRGAAWCYEAGGSILRRFQNGDVQRYAAYVLFGIAAILYWVVF